MAKLTTRFFSYLHSLMVHMPHVQSHNISKIVHPQVRDIAEGLLAMKAKNNRSLDKPGLSKKDPRRPSQEQLRTT